MWSCAPSADQSVERGFDGRQWHRAKLMAYGSLGRTGDNEGGLEMPLHFRFAVPQRTKQVATQGAARSPVVSARMSAEYDCPSTPSNAAGRRCTAM